MREPGSKGTKINESHKPEEIQSTQSERKNSVERLPRDITKNINTEIAVGMIGNVHFVFHHRQNAGCQKCCLNHTLTQLRQITKTGALISSIIAVVIYKALPHGSSIIYIFPCSNRVFYYSLFEMSFVSIKSIAKDIDHTKTKVL